MNDKKEIIKEIGCYYFQGFYESIYSYSDEFLDGECSDKDELIRKYCLNENDIEVVYDYVNFDDYKKDVCTKFIELYIENIYEVLPFEITNDDDYLFEIVDNSIEIDSPTYYNYTTDRCYCDIKTNYYTLDLIKNYALSVDGVEDYIFQHFSSREGFISFISNDFEYWKSLNIKDYEENMLIALLDMLLYLCDNDIFDKIAYGVVDCVCNYEYIDSEIYYQNEKYSWNEFEKIFSK